MTELTYTEAGHKTPSGQPGIYAECRCPECGGMVHGVFLADTPTDEIRKHLTELFCKPREVEA